MCDKTAARMKVECLHLRRAIAACSVNTYIPLVRIVYNIGLYIAVVLSRSATTAFSWTDDVAAFDDIQAYTTVYGASNPK